MDAAADGAGEQAAAPALDVPVRYRRTARQTTVHAVLASVWVALWAVLFVAQSGGDKPLLRLAAPVAVAVVVASVVVLARAGLDLTATHAVVRGLGARRIPWTQVTGVEARRVVLSTTLVLHTAAGPVRAMAPSTGVLDRDPRFDEKVAAARAWWTAARTALLRGGTTTPRHTATGWAVPLVPELDHGTALGHTGDWVD